MITITTMITITGTGTGTITIMAEQPERWGTHPAPALAPWLLLQQLLSPAFPTGAFAYSHGLEAVLAAGELSDAGALERWIAASITAGSAWCDAVLLARGLDAEADLDALAALARALATSAGRWRETLEQGEAFARAGAGLGLPARPGPLSVAMAAACRNLGLPAETVVASALQAFAGNLAVIGVRMIPLGQAEGQSVIARLRPTVLDRAAAAMDTPLDALWTSAFRADIFAMRQEVLPVRLFRT